MAWDASRTVPWKKILTPFGLYAAVAVVLFSLLDGGFNPGLLVGVVAGGGIYTLVAVVMVKFGWNPPMFQSKEERAAAAAAGAERRAQRQAAKGRAPANAASAARAKPAPTRRTNATNPKAKISRR
jgi:predicted lipid-binding transport protein (Tim44 family)